MQKISAPMKLTFINCIAWEKTGEFVNRYFQKGSMINVVGSLRSRRWEDKDGNQHYIIELVVSEVNFCGEKKLDNSNTTEKADNFTPFESEEDLPF